MRCPHCGNTFAPDPKRRVCFKCKDPILRHEKYIFEKSQVRHRNCSGDRTSYVMEEELERSA